MDIRRRKDKSGAGDLPMRDNEVAASPTWSRMNDAGRIQSHVHSQVRTPMSPPGPKDTIPLSVTQNRHETSLRSLLSTDTLVDDGTPRMFEPLATDDRLSRRTYLDQLLPLVAHSERHRGTIALLVAHCPFSDVRVALSSIEGAGGWNASPSMFFKEGEAPGVDHPSYVQWYLRHREASPLGRLHAWRPAYAEKVSTTISELMIQEGPLTGSERGYVGVLAASRHMPSAGARVVMRGFEDEFRRQGGDESWLEGVERASVTMQRVAVLNMVLAHQPWLIDPEKHIEPLLKGASAMSESELVHAVAVSCTVRALVRVSCGVGCILPDDEDNTVDETDTENGNDNGNDRDGIFSEGEVETVTGSGAAATEAMKELLVEGFQKEKPQDAGNKSAAATFAAVSDTLEQARAPSHAHTPASLGLDMAHVDYDVKSPDYSVFRYHDFGWRSHGYEVLARVMPRAASALDKELLHAYEMTDYHFSTYTDVDTTPYRHAIWQYVQRTRGVLHDDYDYSAINKYLNRFNKAFVKKVICYPHTITAADFSDLGYDMQVSEKFHVCALAAESAKMAELLYFTKCLENYRTRR